MVARRAGYWRGLQWHRCWRHYRPKPDADDDSSRQAGSGHNNGRNCVDDPRCGERRAGQGRAPNPADSSKTSESDLGDPQSTGRHWGGGSRIRGRCAEAAAGFAVAGYWRRRGWQWSLCWTCSQTRTMIAAGRLALATAMAVRQLLIYQATGAAGAAGSAGAAGVAGVAGVAGAAGAAGTICPGLQQQGARGQGRGRGPGLIEAPCALQTRSGGGRSRVPCRKFGLGRHDGATCTTAWK